MYVGESKPKNDENINPYILDFIWRWINNTY